MNIGLDEPARREIRAAYEECKAEQQRGGNPTHRFELDSYMMSNGIGTTRLDAACVPAAFTDDSLISLMHCSNHVVSAVLVLSLWSS